MAKEKGGNELTIAVRVLWVITVVVLVGLSLVTMSQLDHLEKYEVDRKIEECESDLPRDQNCTVVAIPVEEHS